MFNALSKKLIQAFQKLKGGVITQTHIDQAIREIRLALLEADVALGVVKQVIEQIKTEALGRQIIQNVRPDQMMIKIVHDVLVSLLFEPDTSLNLQGKPPVSFLIAGLQGTGKTTMAAKIALFLKKQQRKVMLVSLDVYRPAAQKQLQILAEQIGVLFLDPIPEEKPLAIAGRGLREAKRMNVDVVIFDTAGRLTLDQNMMQELIALEKLIVPSEVLLVADACLGQSTLEMAKAFQQAVSISSMALSRTDGDARGGAALSLKYVLQKPLKFLGTGEKLSDLEVFDAKQIANRILDQGDIVALVEKAAEVMDVQAQEKAMRRLEKGIFTLEDLSLMFQQIEKMGGAKGIFKFLPGINSLADDVSQKVENMSFKKQRAILDSMTPKEKRDPNILNGSRKKRIAAGSGTTVQDVNRLLQQFSQMQKMMKQIGQFKKMFKP